MTYAVRASLHHGGPVALCDIAFRKALSEIRNPDGSVVFRLDGIDVPESWSQVASDVLAQEVLRKAGVPARLKKIEEKRRPLLPVALGAGRGGARRASRGGALRLRDLRDAGVRPAGGCWTYWGWKGGYFSSEEDASAFMDELRAMLARQMVAPNSPQWFNTGLHWAYGIDGRPGPLYCDYKTVS